MISAGRRTAAGGSCAVRVCVGLLFFALCLSDRIASSQEGAHLVVHQPPALIRILDVTYLVHELSIENRLASVATITDVTVLDTGHALVSYRGTTLQSHIGRPGLPRAHPMPLVLEPGQSAVVYFWLRLAAKSQPHRLRHQVGLLLAEASSPREIVVDGGAASVSPLGDAEVLDAPLRGAGWAAIYDPALMGGHRTALYTVDGQTRIPGRFAVDFIKLLPSGRAHTDSNTRPRDWNGFGTDVLAVKDAIVASMVSSRPDADASGKPREVVTRENAAGNYIILDLGRGRFAVYEHLQQGSVVVKVGDRVARGQVIGRVGSSGSVSSGPHLHFHVSDGNSLLGAEGLPFVFRQFTERGAFASIDAFTKGEAALPDSPGPEPTRRSSRPSANAIVDFPEL